MTSLMRQETLEISDVISRQLEMNDPLLDLVTEAFHREKPGFILTIARGSSDHAATFVKYLCEMELGLVVSSAAPSVYTVYHAPVDLSKAWAIALSQSGESPDICEVMRYAKSKGALTLALVNETESPLAHLSEYTLPLHAHKEKAVAATKSFMAMLVASLHLVAKLKGDTALLKALQDLPQQLKQMEAPDFSDFLPNYQDAHNALVVGRGFHFSIAQEIALKFKEVTQIHAEGFSGAEVLHGPFSLFHAAFPVLILLQTDASLGSMHALIHKIKTTPVKPLLIGDATALAGYQDLPHLLLPETHPLLTPVLTVFVLYQFVEALAKSQGLNPDAPPLIQKVTRTL